MEYPNSEEQSSNPVSSTAKQGYSNANNRQPLGFGKTMLASGLGMLIAYVVVSIIGFFMFLGMMVSFVTSNTPETVAKNTFLEIDLTKSTPERTPESIQQWFNVDKNIGLIDLLLAIDHAKTDDRINGIYLNLGSITAQSWGQCEELRIALQDFREESHKPVIAYADSYSQAGYYVASVADRVILHPAGQLDWKGIAAQPMFYKDLLDKLHIHVDLIRPANNDYKSAGETYIMNHMSEANKEQVRTYITSIWSHVINSVAESRSCDIKRLQSLADSLSCYDPTKAVNCGLIDTLAFAYDADQFMKDRYQMENTMPIYEYARSLSPMKHSSNQIAIIYAQGNVLPGEGSGYDVNVYGDDVAKSLDEASKEESVKAIVLRVNSPGGAVIGSEVMTAAVMRAREKKPVIVSMSDLAASAGYEISCNATRIVALPTTLTGSIGVFATVPEVGDFLKNTLGITTDTVLTNPNAAGITGMRPMTAQTRSVMQNSIEDFYHTFISRVAKGRGMRVSQVDSIARGRVWTGADAINIGLIDTLGGFFTAVEIACEEAGIKDYMLKDYTYCSDNLFSSLSGFLGTASDKYLGTSFRKSALNTVHVDAVRQELEYWSQMSGLQARLPYLITIK